ncbi:MAG: tetratricopeptide repeat protein, partial [Bythopirellula sp.]
MQQSNSPIDEIARDWDLDFVLEGSVRRDKENLRVSVQLVRLEGRETVWAERFDSPIESVFEIQDEIAAIVAGQLAVHVDEVELENARQHSAESLPAYEAWLRGMDCLNRGTLEGDEESREFFDQALQIDSGYARAFAGLSLSHFNEWTCHAWHLWDDNESNAFDYAAKAAELDDRDPIVQSVLARVCRFRHHHPRADQHIARALSLNPNDARVLIQAAIVKLFVGEPEEGSNLANRAIELNPLHGDWYYGIVGWCQFMMEQYELALDNLRRAAETITNYPAYRAACFAILGDQSEARREYELFEREYRDKIAFGREPSTGEALTWAVQVEPFCRIEDSKRMPEALRQAGIVAVDVDRAIESRKKRMVRPAGIAAPTGNRFQCDEGIWSITYEGEGARLAELKGFHDVARLLDQPNEPLHCLELSGAPQDSATPDDVLDTQSRQEYRQRIE